MLSGVNSIIQGVMLNPKIEPNYQFWIGSDDHSDHVVKWPTISVNANNIISKSISIQLSNEDGTYNKYITSKLNIKDSAKVTMNTRPKETWYDFDNVNSFDWNGVTVSINDEGSTAAISAAGRDVGSTIFGGEVAILNRTNGNKWREKNIITDPLVNTLDSYFGACTQFARGKSTVSHSLDLLFIGQQRFGTPQIGASVGSEGIVYAYVESSNGFMSQVASISPSRKVANANFGNWLDAVYYDHGTHISLLLAIGAPREDNHVDSGDNLTASRAGAMYVFEGSLSNFYFTELQRMTAVESAQALMKYGNAIAFSQDARRLVTTAPDKTESGNTLSGRIYTRVISDTNLHYGSEISIVPNSVAPSSFIGVNNYTQNRTISLNDSGTIFMVGAPWLTQYTASSSIFNQGGVIVCVESSDGSINHHDTVWHPGYSATVADSSDANGLGTFVTAITSDNETTRLLLGCERDGRRIRRGGSVLEAYYTYSSGIEKSNDVVPTEIFSQANYGYFGDTDKNGNYMVVGAVDYGNPKAFVGRSYFHDIRQEASEITLFEGELETFKFGKKKTTAIVRDKLKPFGDIQVGDNENPAVFSLSNLLPSDIFWTLCTCYGGLSSVQSTSNPDINYTAFQEWADVFSGDSVFMGGEFGGTKVLESLRKLSRHTDSTIVVEEGRLTPRRFSSTDTPTANYDDPSNFDFSPSVSDYKLINKQWVLGLYNVTSDEWGIQVFDVNTASVNSFGLKEDTDKDTSLWYVSSANALNLAQRKVTVNKLPELAPGLSLPHIGLIHAAGDIVTVSDSYFDISGESFRVMGYTKDLNGGAVTLNLSDTTLSSPFILDISELDGTDVLT